MRNEGGANLPLLPDETKKEHPTADMRSVDALYATIYLK